MKRSAGRPILYVFGIVSLFVVLMLIAAWYAVRNSRIRDAESLVITLTGAVMEYRKFYGVLPQDSMDSSSVLVTGLSRPGKDGKPILAIENDWLSPSGELLSPTGSVFHYRISPTVGPVGFMIWTADPRKDGDTLNNWSPGWDSR